MTVEEELLGQYFCVWLRAMLLSVALEMSLGVLTHVQCADQLHPVALGFGEDASALVSSMLLCNRRGKLASWFCLVFRVWGYRKFNVPTKQNSDLWSSFQCTILPERPLWLLLSADSFKDGLRAWAPFIPAELPTEDPLELERNHDVNQQTTLVPKPSAVPSHSVVSRAGLAGSEGSVPLT